MLTVRIIFAWPEFKIMRSVYVQKPSDRHQGNLFPLLDVYDMNEQSCVSDRR